MSVCLSFYITITACLIQLWLNKMTDRHKCMSNQEAISCIIIIKVYVWQFTCMTVLVAAEGTGQFPTFMYFYVHFLKSYNSFVWGTDCNLQCYSLKTLLTFASGSSQWVELKSLICEQIIHTVFSTDSLGKIWHKKAINSWIRHHYFFYELSWRRAGALMIFVSVQCTSYLVLFLNMKALVFILCNCMEKITSTF